MRRKFVRGQFKDADDARRTIASLENQRTRQRRRCEQLGWLLGFQEKDSLLEAFTLSFFALERWPTTTDYSDFNQISSTLMLGALCHKCLGVQEQDLMDDIQHAAFMTVVCARLRNHGKEIPPANLEPVKHGLIVAQQLMEYAYEHERQALINVLKHNTHENIAETSASFSASTTSKYANGSLKMTPSLASFKRLENSRNKLRKPNEDRHL